MSTVWTVSINSVHSVNSVNNVDHVEAAGFACDAVTLSLPTLLTLSTRLTLSTVPKMSVLCCAMKSFNSSVLSCFCGICYLLFFIVLFAIVLYFDFNASAMFVSTFDVLVYPALLGFPRGFQLAGPRGSLVPCSRVRSWVSLGLCFFDPGFPWLLWFPVRAPLGPRFVSGFAVSLAPGGSGPLWLVRFPVLFWAFAVFA